MKYYNNLNPAELERISLLVEELGEAIQAAGKVLRHGYAEYHPDVPETTNRVDLAKELGHVWCAMQLMVEQQDISVLQIEFSRAAKHESVKKWLHHQEAK